MRQIVPTITPRVSLAIACLAMVAGLAVVGSISFADRVQAEEDATTTEETTATSSDSEEDAEEDTTATSSEEGASCEANEECEWRSVNCCPPNAGAQWECVNASEFEPDCPDEEDLVCPQVMSPKPEESCQCTEGECQAKETGDEEQDEEDEDEDSEEEQEREREQEKEKNVCVGRNGFLRPGVECCEGLVPYSFNSKAEEGTTSTSSNATSTSVKKDSKIGPPSTRARCFAPVEECSTDLAPVCGENGQTYPNECVAQQKDATVKHEGECQEDQMVKRIKSRARALFQGDMDEIMKGLGEKIQDKLDQVEEKVQQGLEKVQDKLQQTPEEAQKHLGKIEKRMDKINKKAQKAIENFVSHGVDKNTQKLGAGERSAVVHSFEKAFGKLPDSQEDVEDMIKISNGRWPEMRSPEAEQDAKEKFREIYDRVPDMSNPKDRAAVTVMAYGLRQKAENRNMEAEKKGIQIFENLFGHAPSSTEEWNTMQAITYSGATRKTDSDGDFLSDEREKELGTDVNDPDTDGDGYKDGIEVANGYDPLTAEE